MTESIKNKYKNIFNKYGSRNATESPGLVVCY